MRFIKGPSALYPINDEMIFTIVPEVSGGAKLNLSYTSQPEKVYYILDVTMQQTFPIEKRIKSTLRGLIVKL